MNQSKYCLQCGAISWESAASVQDQQQWSVMTFDVHALHSFANQKNAN
jgi:hypothetical protein